MQEALRKYKAPLDLRPAVAQPSQSNHGDFRLYNDLAIGDLFQNAVASSASQTVRSVLHKLCSDHPTIGVDSKMLGGQPHIKGFRLSVGDILAKLYTHGNTERVRELYPDLSLDQVKEAIAFAQDFLEEMSVQR
jgi:uncharacterized protein (DUF433 family)